MARPRISPPSTIVKNNALDKTQCMKVLTTSSGTLFLYGS